MPTKQSAQVFLVGYYGIGNLGDEAILNTLLRSTGETESRIANYAVRSDMYAHDARAVRLRSKGFYRYLRAVARADRVVLGGGGILKDEGLGGPVELLLTALLAKLLGKRVILLGAGVGPLYGRLGRNIIKAVANLCDLRIVRDQESVSLLGEMGVSDVIEGSDCIFATPLDDGSFTKRQRMNTIGVSLRPWFLRDPDRRTKQLELEVQIAVAIEAGAPRASVLGLPLYVPEDIEVLSSLASELSSRRRAIEMATPLAWDTLLSSVSGCSSIVAMRYHAVAAAALTGTPCVVIAYEPKVQALARQLGIQSVSVDDPDLGDRVNAMLRKILRGDAEEFVAEPEAVSLLRERAIMGILCAFS